jgi:hypothetical protein
MTVTVTEDQVRVLLSLQNIDAPAGDVSNIALRLTIWLSAFEEIEAELGDRLFEVDPIPPILPV